MRERLLYNSPLTQEARTAFLLHFGVFFLKQFAARKTWGGWALNVGWKLVPGHWSFRAPHFIPVLLLFFSLAFSLNAATTTEATLERDFTSTVHPFLETYCFGCH